MRIEFTATFERDLEGVTDQRIAERVVSAIENVRQAKTPHDIHQIKALKGTDKAYRIRIGEYRLGLYIVGDTVRFVHCLDRKEIYRFFP